MIYTEDKIIELINKSKKHKTETYNIEFKDARGGMPKIWRTISSFAHNPEGGVIIFGLIEDKNTRDLIKADLEDIALLQEQIASYFSDIRKK